MEARLRAAIVDENPVSTGIERPDNGSARDCECDLSAPTLSRTEAITPSLTPVSWFSRLCRAVVSAFRGYSAHALSQQAAAIAFRVLFSLVPLVALLVSIVDLVVPDKRRDEVIEWIVVRLSGTGALEESVRRALTASDTSASVVGVVALGGLIWAASGMMGSIRRAFQTVWEDSTPRSYVRGKLVDFVVVLGVGLLAIAAFGLGIAVQAVVEVGSDIAAALDIETAGNALSATAGGAATLALTFGGFLALYRVVAPSPPPWEALWPGAAIGAVGFQAATTVYGSYLAKFGDLNVIYGSLGAVLGFLLVVWVGAIAMLFGAEVAAGWQPKEHALLTGIGDAPERE
jgi:membrane protein